MPKTSASKERRINFFERVIQLINEYPRILLVNADNVRSSQIANIRRSIRGIAVLLMGKNTLIKKAISQNIAQFPQIEPLLPYIRGNVGLVFTKEDVNMVRRTVAEIKISAAAKPGSVAPVDIIIPKGNTGLEPTKTSFLQALNIPSKIEKGQIQVLNDVVIVKTGDKVGQSQCALFALLDIKPFTYTLNAVTVYDNGMVYSSDVLDITDEIILESIQTGIANIASISLALKHPTLASFPHMVINAYKNVLALSVATDYSYKYSEKIKEIIANPEAFAAPAAPVQAPVVEDVEEKAPESEDDEGGDFSLGLFGDDDE